MRLLSPRWMRKPPETQPYRWSATAQGDLFDTAIAQELARTFPLDCFERREADGNREKSYRNHSRNIPSEDGPHDALLPPCWCALIEDLRSAEYRRGVATLLEQPVSPKVELRLVRHAPGDFLGAHTDRSDKLFSHIFYFNERWQHEWGGFFEILEGATNVVARIMPALGTSVLLARSDNSWHRVSPVASGDAPERRSLLVHGVLADT